MESNLISNFSNNLKLRTRFRLPDVLECGRPGNHDFGSELDYVLCVFGGFGITDFDDARQKAANLEIEFNASNMDELVAETGELFARVLSKACDCGADQYCQ